MIEIFAKSRAKSSIHSSAAGRQIDVNDEQPENAFAPMQPNFDPESKVTEERDLHSKKHFAQRIVTDDGIQIDFSDER
jgi:hypothetical protein